ncbi:hypothetical protein [Roseovarius spongiae]|nr:hypothetical protein [Roseovarius spongiae]
MDFNELIVRFASTIARRKALFFLIFIVVFLGAVGGAYVKPQKFESNAKLFITLQTPRINSTHSEERQVAAILQPEEVLSSQVEFMQTREITEELVDTLPEWVFVSEPSNKWYVRLIVKPLMGAWEFVKGMLRKARLIEPENERFNRISMIEKNLDIFPVRKAMVIEIGFTSKNPEVPPVVINELVALYQKRVEALRENIEGAMLYSARAEELSAELRAAEQARTDFLRQHDIADFETERQTLLGRISVQRLRADEERLEELMALEPEYNALSRQVALLSESFRIYRQVAADRQTFFERDTSVIAQLIDPPSAIYHPLKPGRLALVLIGFFFSLFLATIVVLVTEWIAQVRGLYGRKEVKPYPLTERVRAAE